MQKIIHFINVYSNRLKLCIEKYTIKHKNGPLGRWNIVYCNETIYRKIDLSNEDHCGPCGNFLLNPTSPGHPIIPIVKDTVSNKK